MNSTINIKSAFAIVIIFLSFYFSIVNSVEAKENQAVTKKALADFEKAFDIFGEGDYQRAIKIWSGLAQAGNVEAQFILGVVYYEGTSVAKNLPLAEKYFRNAAEQGNGDAQYILATMYSEGEGVPQNYEMAAYLLKLSSEAGIPEAQVNLAGAYFSGRGIAKDNIQALMWATVAATNAKTLTVLGYDNAEEVAKESIKVIIIVSSQMSATEKAKSKTLADSCVKKRFIGC